MKRNKLFVILLVIIAALVFTTAQICNQCGIAPAQDTAEDVEKVTGEKETSSDTTARETAAGTTSTTISGDPEEPTIKLQVYMGPEYHAPDDVCFYRVEAVVTGNPMPTEAVFSKDDSGSSWGPLRAQVNLTRAEPDYTLTASVATSSGTDEDSIDLSWDCGPLAIEQSEDFHPTDIASVNATGGVNIGIVEIGDTFFDVDVRGLFAFDISSMADKDVVSAELKLENPTLDSVCDFKGDIWIWYVDFLPGGITGTDYFAIPYAGPVSFSWDADPLEFSSDLLKDTIIDRAPLPRKLQFGIMYENDDIGGDMGVPEGRKYEPDDITLTVTYNK